MKKGKVDNKIRDIISDEEFYKNKDSYISNKQVAVEWNNSLYPMRGKFENTPGIYSNNAVTMFISPKTEEQRDIYSNENIIDFDSVKTMSEMIEKNNTLKDMEKSILTTTSDNIFVPVISDKDTPEMRILKEAVQLKHIDLDKYEDRFNGNYMNDKRLLLKDRITFPKLRDLMDILDLKGTLILEDKNPNVPNPMKTKLVTDLATVYTDIEIE